MKYVCTLNGINEVIKGYTVLATLPEFYRAVPQAKEVIFKRDFIDAYFTDSVFAEFISEVKKLNKKCRFETHKEYTRETEADVLLSMGGYKDLVDYLFIHKEKGFEVISSLIKNYEDFREERVLNTAKLSNLHMQVAELKEELEVARARYDNLSSTSTETRSRLDRVVTSVRNRYGVDLDRQVVESNSFESILYIKEITRVHYVDSLVYYIGEIMRSLQEVPVKQVAIEPLGADDRIALYPDYSYYGNLTVSRLITDDIFLAGRQIDVLSKIMDNPGNSYYAIVLDRSGGSDILVKGDNVKVFYTIASENDKYIKAQDSRFISYKSDGLYIPHKEGFDKMTPEARINYYSNLDITKKLINEIVSGQRV